jgi:predicted AlkP superfamily phosphohydrolase/phosphomutase
MRYLRMLSNSVIAAALASAYVLTLVLALNPSVPLTPQGVIPLISTVGLYYTLNLTVLAYIVLVFWQLLSLELFSPAWISVGVLVWLGAFAAAVGSALVWRNVTTFALVLDDSAETALARIGIALTLAAVAFVLVAVIRRTLPEGRPGWATLLVIVMGASVAFPLALRGRGVAPVLEARPIDAEVDGAVPERTTRVTIIALDAASLDFITSATAEGRLPNFGRLLDRGAVRHLATLHPTSTETVWAAVATGKLPQKNGIHSAGLYRFTNASGVPLQLLPEYCFAHGLVRLGVLTEEPHSSATFRTRTLWSILSTHGITIGVVGWPLSQPAPTVRGFLVADSFHRSALTAAAVGGPATIYPAELQPDAIAAMETAGADAMADSAGADESPARIDRVYESVAQKLSERRAVQVAVTRYQSLDPIGHHYLRYATPSEFGDVTDDERQRLGGVLERHYEMIDEAVGRTLGALGPDDLLVVVSAFGMVPLTLGKRIVEKLLGDPDLSGTHDAAPDGFLIAYGTSVARGRSQTRASVVDVTPTLLYFLGLPVGRDMDGYVRTDLFSPSFIQDRPIAYIPTYDR